MVLDSNIWISATAWGGLPADVVKLAERGHIKIFISTPILSEINRILSYDKLAQILQETAVKRSEIIAAIAKTAEHVSPKLQLNVIAQDPSDNRVLECAIEAKGEYIVSGNKHLLNLGEYQRVRILSPREFLEKIK